MRDLDDHRAVVVQLTRRGRALWREMNVTYRRAVQAHVSSHLSNADVAALHRVLGRLSHATTADELSHAAVRSV